jgi:cation diffusion facilitator CzcD-associated flavoprotein CzcO
MGFVDHDAGFDAGFDARFDAVIIGAGFSGLHMLHELRRLGLRTIVLEMADAIGGTWLVDRYPGARCDIESIEYSYSSSEEIQQDWAWRRRCRRNPRSRPTSTSWPTDWTCAATSGSTRRSSR